VLQDVGNREIIAERAIDEHGGSRSNGDPHGNTGASRRLAQRIVIADKGIEPGKERIDAQCEPEHEGEASNLWHC